MYQVIKQRWLARDVVKVLMTGMLIALVIQGLFASTLSHVIEARIGHGEFALFGFVIGASALSGIIQALRWGWEPFVAPKTGRWFDGLVMKERTLCWMFLSFGGLSFLAVMLKVSGWFLVMLLLIQLLSTILTTLTDTLAFQKRLLKQIKPLPRKLFLCSRYGSGFRTLVRVYDDSVFGSSSVFWLMLIISLLLVSMWARGRELHVTSDPA